MALSGSSIQPRSPKNLSHPTTTRKSGYKPSLKPAGAIGSRVEKRRKSTTLNPEITHKEKRRNEQQTTSRQLIHVFVNNRLGARYEIVCSSSDAIGDFKKLVAFYSGTKALTIMLKRQGQRPFKDSLTLGDYEIGDGSSLDLEIDTTD
ncbi:ubiquitin-like protein 5, partial [Lecanoromycetidae sp. Uapishka_2]